MKERADQEQIAFVKKGVKEVASYMHRSDASGFCEAGQMRRNRVAYNAYSDDESERKRTVVNDLDGDEDESEEMNEEEQYLQEIRRERLLGEMAGKEEEEEADAASSESDKDAFDPEEAREMEAFKERLKQKRELERSRSMRNDFHSRELVSVSLRRCDI